MKFTIISGTNRPGSNTRRIANFTESLLREKVKKGDTISLLDLCDLPQEIFSPKAYAEKPKSFEVFRDGVTQADALLCVLPEYNGAAPGVFKYFIDMLPFPQSLQKIPSFFVGVAAGRFGALRAIEQTQQVFRYRNAYLYPESVYLMAVDQSTEPSGKPKDEFVLKLFHQSLEGFVDFTHRLRG
jgi:chromate reductase, NAD(P)H dehydrogenase (quinone)